MGGRILSMNGIVCRRRDDAGVELLPANRGVCVNALLLTAMLVVGTACGRVSHVDDRSQPSLAVSSESPVRPVFSEQLVCVIHTDELRWQHMYRLDMAQNQAEFVGGFGLRIVALRSQAMGVYPDFVEAFFPASDQVSDAEFKVTIQRDDLSYWIEVTPTGESRADNSIPARLSGRCSILDGRGFLTVQPKGAQVRQTLRNHDKAMAAATRL